VGDGLWDVFGCEVEHKQSWGTVQVVMVKRGCFLLLGGGHTVIVTANLLVEEHDRNDVRQSEVAADCIARWDTCARWDVLSLSFMATTTPSPHLNRCLWAS
jgi:hypothetical protein